MTDFEPTNNQPDDEPVTDDLVNDFDVESALAAVASLDDLVATPDHPIEIVPEPEHTETLRPLNDLDDDTPFDFDEPDAIEVIYTTNIVAPPDETIIESGTLVVPISKTATGEFAAIGVPERSSNTLPQPPMSVLYRGQMASVVPALLLIVAGVALTFLLRTSGIVFTRELIFAGILAGFGLMMLAQWLSSRRWSGGNLLFGLNLICVSGVLAYFSQPATPPIVEGWPLLLSASGLAVIIAGLLSRQRVGNNWVLGLMGLLVGLGGWVFTGNLLDATFIQTITPYLIVVPIILVILLIAPVFRRWVR